jgi:hypothetical protein
MSDEEAPPPLTILIVQSQRDLTTLSSEPAKRFAALHRMVGCS